MINRFDGFDWDEFNSIKCQKHGLSLREIEDLFVGKFFIAPDLKHSDSETRFLAIGKPKKSSKPIFVVFTIRESASRKLIRPISARYMHKKEIEKYEKEFS